MAKELVLCEGAHPFGGLCRACPLPPCLPNASGEPADHFSSRQNQRCCRLPLLRRSGLSEPFAHGANCKRRCRPGSVLIEIREKAGGGDGGFFFFKSLLLVSCQSLIPYIRRKQGHLPFPRSPAPGPTRLFSLSDVAPPFRVPTVKFQKSQGCHMAHAPDTVAPRPFQKTQEKNDLRFPPLSARKISQRPQENQNTNLSSFTCLRISARRQPEAAIPSRGFCIVAVGCF